MHNSGQSPGGLNSDHRLHGPANPTAKPEYHPAIDISYKKSKKKTLTTEERDYNHALSSFRVRFERSIGRLKFFRVLSERYRYPRNRYACKISIVAGITNFATGP